MYVCCVSLYTVMSLSCCTIFLCLLFIFFLFFLWIVIFSIICFSFKSIHFCKKKKKKRIVLLICMFLFILHFTQFPYHSSLPRLCLYSKARQQSFPSYPVVCVWLPAADFSSLSFRCHPAGCKGGGWPTLNHWNLDGRISNLKFLISMAHCSLHPNTAAAWRWQCLHGSHERCQVRALSCSYKVRGPLWISLIKSQTCSE